MTSVLEGGAAVLSLLTSALSIALFAGTSMGVVREHCIDVESTNASRTLDVDSGWTYIIWPPLTFANVDPNGRCVRNAPLREALSAAGVWELGTPEDQVLDHLSEQGLLEPSG